MTSGAILAGKKATQQKKTLKRTNKMKFGKIPKRLLDLQLGEGYDCTWTLRSELEEKVKEDIEGFDYLCYDEDRRSPRSIRCLHVWSKTKVGIVVDTPFGDKVLYVVSKEPNKELREYAKSEKEKS